MKKIDVQMIEDGMVLAKPLIGSTGNVLLAQGVALKAALANRFSSWGVSDVYIEDEDEIELENGESPEQYEAKLKESLLSIFSGKLDNPNMQTLFQCILEHRLEKTQ